MVALNCSAVRVIHPLSKAETSNRTALALPKCAYKPVSVMVVCPACSVFRPTDHIPGSAGNRLSPSLGTCVPDEQTPPVVDQRNGTGRQLAAVQVNLPSPVLMRLVRSFLALRLFACGLRELQRRAFLDFVICALLRPAVAPREIRTIPHLESE